MGFSWPDPSSPGAPLPARVAPVASLLAAGCASGTGSYGHFVCVLCEGGRRNRVPVAKGASGSCGDIRRVLTKSLPCALLPARAILLVDQWGGL